MSGLWGILNRWLGTNGIVLMAEIIAIIQPRLDTIQISVNHDPIVTSLLDDNRENIRNLNVTIGQINNARVRRSVIISRPGAIIGDLPITIANPNFIQYSSNLFLRMIYEIILTPLYRTGVVSADILQSYNNETIALLNRDPGYVPPLYDISDGLNAQVPGALPPRAPPPGAIGGGNEVINHAHKYRKYKHKYITAKYH